MRWACLLEGVHHSTAAAGDETSETCSTTDHRLVLSYVHPTNTHTHQRTYDTIRYDIFTCAQKLTIWPGQLSPAHGTETKK